MLTKSRFNYLKQGAMIESNTIYCSRRKLYLVISVINCRLKDLVLNFTQTLIFSVSVMYANITLGTVDRKSRRNLDSIIHY